jgi:hypothetical protein
MNDDNNSLHWGVKPLPKGEREGVRTGVGARTAAMPTRPPSGGSAVPPPPLPKPKENDG